MTIEQLFSTRPVFGGLALVAAILATGCAAPPQRDLDVPDPVAWWHEVATRTINQPPGTSGTAAERRPLISNDLAMVQLAEYDAMQAIVKTHQPYAFRPMFDTTGAMPEAAIAAAARTMLQLLYPQRASSWEPAYAQYLALLPDTPARSLGARIGEAAAHKLAADRADDGRHKVLAAFEQGTAPGEYRGADPILRFRPDMQPFALRTADQFRAPPPPALGSAQAVRDEAESRALGGADSTARTAEQLEAARFHTEPPGAFWPRNVRRLIAPQPTLAQRVRFAAIVAVAMADVEIACFESKYQYRTWRPFTALVTAASPAWRPVLPTPPHPEYPAAHSCVAGALTAAIDAHAGHERTAFTLDSTVTTTTRTYKTTRQLVDEIQMARIAGGMHFRSATQSGEVLGRQVGQWVTQQLFLPASPP